MSTALNTQEEARRIDRLSRLGILEAPMGYVDGMNTYEFVGSDPLGKTDPMGLQSKPSTTQPTTGPTTKPGVPTTQPGATTRPAPAPAPGPAPAPATAPGNVYSVPVTKKQWCNSRVVNGSTSPVLIWNTGGFGILPPGMSTPADTDDGDWVKYGGSWYKVQGIFTAQLNNVDAPYVEHCQGHALGGFEGKKKVPLTAGPDSNGWWPEKFGPALINVGGTMLPPPANIK